MRMNSLLLLFSDSILDKPRLHPCFASHDLRRKKDRILSRKFQLCLALVVLEMLAQPELLGHRTMSRNLKPRFAGKPGRLLGRALLEKNWKSPLSKDTNAKTKSIKNFLVGSSHNHHMLAQRDATALNWVSNTRSIRADKASLFISIGNIPLLKWGKPLCLQVKKAHGDMGRVSSSHWKGVSGIVLMSPSWHSLTRGDTWLAPNL